MRRYKLRNMKFIISLGIIYHSYILGSNFQNDIKTKNPKNRRVGSQLKRLVESSEILLLVLDSKNPIGSYFNVRKYSCNNKSEVILILNKSDTVSKFTLKVWKRAFSKIFNVISVNSGAKTKEKSEKLLNWIKKFGFSARKKKKTENIGIIGTPNVGKSSLVNFLLKKRSAKISKRSGDTISWQFFRINRFFYLIDSPGIQYECDQDNYNKLSEYTRLLLEQKNGLEERSKESKNSETPLDLTDLFNETIIKNLKHKNKKSENNSTINCSNFPMNLDIIPNLVPKKMSIYFSPEFRLNLKKRRLNSVLWKINLRTPSLIPS